MGLLRSSLDIERLKNQCNIAHPSDAVSQRSNFSRESQQSQTSSKLSIHRFMSQNSGYFQHLQGQCICFQCECGGCKCGFQKVKLSAPFSQNSHYSNNFRFKAQIKDLNIPCKSKWHSHNENQKFISINSTVQEDFQKIFRYTIPEFKKSRENSPKMQLKTSESNYQMAFKKPEKTPVPPCMPNIDQLYQTRGIIHTARSNYQQNYSLGQSSIKMKAFTFPDNIKSIQFPINKSTYQNFHQGLQNPQPLMVKKSNKQIIYEKSRKLQVPYTKSENSLFNKNIFLTQNNKSFKNNQVQICPVKAKLIDQKS